MVEIVPTNNTTNGTVPHNPQSRTQLTNRPIPAINCKKSAKRSMLCEPIFLTKRPLIVVSAIIATILRPNRYPKPSGLTP
ncbi:Uncharacterised protein [Vibrio cholerae]|uniref:Uncharacterized protein n=2 Tax=Vibrio cholerae TaxID=666 RepID=A0A655RSS0_VIBCL|nr:Uncharacterised protein [Vibrio cholerae]CSB08332.1 Uncharacterised protein [Vibrio cholerae]CSC30387.1 Uncharacterised protein [Vibrio cholerae]CSD30097.1 Uncharacterised protein [Vibrio cholerae]